MAILQINSTDIPDPRALSWDIYDLEDSDGTGRNQNGTLFRDRIAVKRKIKCDWPALSNAQMSALLQAMSGVTFELTYPDALTGTQETMTVYVGDRSTPMYRYDSTSGWLWQGISAEFVEV